MPKIVCKNCSYILNLSEIPNAYEFDLFAAKEVDDFLLLVFQKTLHYSDIKSKLAIFSDLWAEDFHS